MIKLRCSYKYGTKDYYIIKKFAEFDFSFLLDLDDADLKAELKEILATGIGTNEFIRKYKLTKQIEQRLQLNRNYMAIWPASKDLYGDDYVFQIDDCCFEVGPDEAEYFNQFENDPEVCTKYMKAAEVMKYLGITRQTLSNYVKSGLIEVVPTLSGKQYLYVTESVTGLKLRQMTKAEAISALKTLHNR